jgi:uncharacterized protein YodC (DUF2158 family)
MSQKFQVGDVVRLKSGGPNMTVTNYAVYPFHSTEAQYQCKWFDEKHKQGNANLELFKEAELEPVTR